MEQRSDTNIPPVTAAGAGVDPAYVPGLVSLRAPGAGDSDAEAQASADRASGRAEKSRQSDTPEPSDMADGTADTGADPSRPAGDGDASDENVSDGSPDVLPEDGAGVGADTADGAGAGDNDDGGTDAPDDGPTLDVSDRRASITAGRSGVRFTLDDQEADFRWDEIGAVEVVVPRFGKRFTVVVHTHLGRSYETDAEAPSRTALKEWNTRLDAVLDTYFEDGEETGPRTAEESPTSDTAAEPAGADRADAAAGEATVQADAKGGKGGDGDSAS